MSTPNRLSFKGILGIDIDNVLSDTDFMIRKIIEQEYGIESTKEQITNWNYSKSLAISVEQENRVFQLFHNQYCIFAPLIPFASESLRTLSNSYSIWLITGRPTQTSSLTEQWLNQHNIVYDNLIYSYKKSDYFESLDLLIEDNGETAIAFASNHIPVILFNNPWNTAYHHANIFRVSNWHQALRIVEKTKHTV